MHEQHTAHDPMTCGHSSHDEVKHFILDHRINTIHSDVSDMKTAMKDIASAMTQMALVEERQVQISIALERTTKLQDKLGDKVEAYQVMNVAALKEVERRIDVLEAEAPTNRQASNWMFAGVAGFIGLIAPPLVGKLMGGGS